MLISDLVPGHSGLREIPKDQINSVGIMCAWHMGDPVLPNGTNEQQPNKTLKKNVLMAPQTRDVGLVSEFLTFLECMLQKEGALFPAKV